MKVDTAHLAEKVAQLLDAYSVPGAAISVLRGGEPVFRHLHGVTSVDSGRPMHAAATFDIGSVSKTFNAAAVALLVDQGLVDWDDAVIDHLPGWRLSDPTVTPHARIRDLVGQSLGLGEDNITNYHSHFARERIIEQIRCLPLRVPLRSECTYQSYGPISAGAVVERLTGRSWEEFVETEIAGRLGLGETFASFFRMPDRAIACDAHVTAADGTSYVVPHRNFDNLAPAGSMVSSLRDMERWFSLFALGGAVDGTRLLKPATVAEMLRPHILVRHDGIHPQRFYSRYEARLVGYGCGWYAHDFAGHMINEHTGALEGFLVLGCAVPAEGLAIVILTNQHKSDAVHALRYLLLAAWLGVPEQPWDERFRAVSAAARRAPRILGGEPYFWRPLHRAGGTAPSLPLADYAGDYTHPMFGTIPVRLGAQGLEADVMGNPSDLEHWHHDLFRAVPRDPVVATYYTETFLRFAREDSGPRLRLEAPTIGTFRAEG